MILRLSKCGECCRALAFDVAGFARPPFDDAARRRMDLGHQFEALVVERLRGDGFTIDNQQRMVALAGVPGHIDGTIARDDMPARLLEIKSMGSSSWRDWRANGVRYARAPYVRAYYSQVQAYMDGLRDVGVLVDACQFVVAFRDDSPDPCARDFEVEHETIPYDEDHVEVVRYRLARALHEAPGEHLREHGLDGGGFLAAACKWCDHRVPCWGELVTVKLGRSEKLMPVTETEF